jgi:hypothetical protein
MPHPRETIFLIFFSSSTELELQVSPTALLIWDIVL